MLVLEKRTLNSKTWLIRVRCETAAECFDPAVPLMRVSQTVHALFYLA